MLGARKSMPAEKNSKPMNIIESIHEHARARPGAAAIITSQVSIAWSQLDNLIWTAALRFADIGLKAGDRVGISITCPVKHLVFSLALARLGIAHLAIPVSESDQIRNDLVEKLGLKIVVCDLENVVVSTRKGMLLTGLRETRISNEEKARLGSTDVGLTWLILQSSGTTGKPKFSELTHAAARDRFIRYLPLFRCNERDIFWAASRPDFVVAKQRLTFSLMAGAAVCLPADGTISAELVNFLNQHRVTLACGTPSHLHQFIAVAEPVFSLRAFEARSAFINEKLRQDFKASISPNLYVVYGTNEGEALAIADPAQQLKVPNTVGVATGSITIEIVDTHGIAVPALETGEVRVKGSGVITSYLEDPEASAKSFRNGWFYPGDLGYMTEDGALVLQGRKDDMMIFDGMNIYPAEIENVLSSHPAVNEVAAFSLSHEQFQDVPVAAVTLKTPASEQELIEFCKSPLGIKFPRRVFVLDEFPRNQLGKILKRELKSTVFTRR